MWERIEYKVRCAVHRSHLTEAMQQVILSFLEMKNSLMLSFHRN